MAPTAHKLGGKDLPHGPLSAYVEGQVKKRLSMAYEAEAKEKGIPVDQVRKGTERKGTEWKRGRAGEGHQMLQRVACDAEVGSS